MQTYEISHFKQNKQEGKTQLSSVWLDVRLKKKFKYSDKSSKQGH